MPEIPFTILQGLQNYAWNSVWTFARVAKSSPRSGEENAGYAKPCLSFGSQLCRGCKILSEIQFILLPGMQWGKLDSVWISAGCLMKVFAFKSSYPGGVNNAPDSGKPYPTGNIVPEIRLMLYPRGWNLPPNSVETLPRWEFYALNPVHTLPQWEYRAGESVWTLPRWGMLCPRFRADFPPVGNDEKEETGDFLL